MRDELHVPTRSEVCGEYVFGKAYVVLESIWIIQT